MFRPSAQLSETQINKGLNLVVKDGLAAEAMSTLTGGAFLTAIALYLGASDFQLGLLSALPTLTNVFQLFAIWLVQKYNNRKAIAVVSNTLARFPLLVIGLLPVLFKTGTSLQVLLFLLCFHYFFGSVAGASWNSWMKDLVPESKLGSYYSHRTRLIQILNVTLSLAIALAIDHVKVHYPQYEMTAYSAMFLTGGLLGMLGVYVLSRTPEPKAVMNKEHLIKLFSKPLKDQNFRKLLTFHSCWAFAINLAIPFYSAYMMKVLGLSLSYIIVLNIVSQLSGILFIKAWGRYSDKFSNKTIIQVSAPLYAVTVLMWIFTAHSAPAITHVLLIVINIFSGLSFAGVNLAVNNIGIKLAPREEAIAYISARNMIVAIFSSLAPILAGLVGDLFATYADVWNLHIKGPASQNLFLEIGHFRFLFVIAAVLGILSLRLLKQVKEDGAVERRVAIIEMRSNFRHRVKARMVKPIVRPLYLPALLSERGRKRLIRLRRHQRAA